MRKMKRENKTYAWQIRFFIFDSVHIISHALRSLFHFQHNLFLCTEHYTELVQLLGMKCTKREIEQIQRASKNERRRRKKCASPSTLLNVYQLELIVFYLFRSFVFIQCFMWQCVPLFCVARFVTLESLRSHTIFSARYCWLRCYWSCCCCCSSFATERENCSVMQLGANWQRAREKKSYHEKCV